MKPTNSDPRYYGRNAVKYGVDVSGRIICWFRYHGYYLLPPFVTVQIFNHTSVKFCYTCRSGKRVSAMGHADKPGELLHALTEVVNIVADDGYLFRLKVRRSWIDDPQGRVSNSSKEGTGYVPIPPIMFPHHPSDEKNIRVGRVGHGFTYSQLCRAVEKEAYKLKDWFVEHFTMSVEEALSFNPAYSYPAECIKEKYDLTDRSAQFNLKNLGLDEHGNKLVRIGGMGLYAIPTYINIYKTAQGNITARYVDKHGQSYTRSVRVKKFTGGAVLECMRMVYEVAQEDGCLFSRPIKREWLANPTVTVRYRQGSDNWYMVSIPVPLALRKGRLTGKKEWYVGSGRLGTPRLQQMKDLAYQRARKLRDDFIEQFELTVDEALIRIST